MNALTSTVKNMGAARSAALLVVAVAMIAGFLIMALRVSSGSMSPLYTGLTLEDSSRIIAELDKSSTPYEIVGNGSEIMVPSDRVLRLRMTMAQQGIPATGSVVGYEIFDRSETFGSSNFVMNINMMRALEGELSRTIASISDVESARVHLVMPKHELFTRDKEQPSASVTVKTRGGRTLESSEVNAVTHLVAAAVPGLDSSKVTVVDNHGRLLARGNGSESEMASANAMENRVNFENKTQKNLEDLVEKVIGAGKVRVQVSADMNFDRLVVNSEKYDPEGQVVRSTQSNSERDNSQDKMGGGSVSAGTNLPAAAAAPAEPGTNSNHMTERTDETTNYEISKTVQNHVSEGGNINKLSVAVLVDGTYAKDADGKETYTPRPDADIKQLTALVKSAIGFDEKRGDQVEIVNMRFTQDAFNVADESFFERFKMEMQAIMQTLIIAVVAILAIVLVLRPAVNQLIRSQPALTGPGGMSALEAPMAMGRLPGAGGQDSAASATDTMIDVANINGGMKSSTIKKMTDIVDKYPDETMNVLRSWVLRQS